MPETKTKPGATFGWIVIVLLLVAVGGFGYWASTQTTPEDISSPRLSRSVVVAPLTRPLTSPLSSTSH